MRQYILIICAVILYSTNNNINAQKLSKGIYAEINTERGDILLELYPEKAPLTVANFVGLAEGNLTVFDTIEHKEPFFDSITFHRVVNDFVVQAGDPTGKGNGGPGYRFFDETFNGLKHDSSGVLSMANAGANTNGSQFFITHVPTPHLNGKHTVFGTVIDGLDVVNKIKQGDEIYHIKIIKKGLKYRWFYNPTKIFKKQYNHLEEENRKREEAISKLEAKNDVRLVEAKNRSKEEYQPYFLELVQEEFPDAKQTETGLVYYIEEEGDGEKPSKGDEVTLHYEANFVFGEKFDSSRDRGNPLNFKFQETNLIPGFNEGVGLSSKGTKVKLFIPYFLAYGEKGRMPNIRPYSDLVFDIEILNVE